MDLAFAHTIDAVSEMFRGHPDIKAFLVVFAFFLLFLLGVLKFVPEIARAIASRLKSEHDVRIEAIGSLDSKITGVASTVMEIRGDQLGIKANVEDMRYEMNCMRQDIDALQKVRCDAKDCPSRLRRSTDLPAANNPNSTAPSR